MDTLTLKEILAAEAVSAIRSTMYVWYDDLGTITGISNYPSNGPYLEVHKLRLIDFLSGKKDYCRYNIDYFKFDNALTIKDYSPKISSALVYDIPKVGARGIADCTIIHNSELEQWELELSDDAKTLLSQINPSTIFEFHLTSVNDPHILYKTISLVASHMLSPKPMIFKSNIERDINMFSISTFGYFKSYGVLVV